jgi:hypothetical protein
MVERVRFNPKTSSKSITPTQARFALFGQPQLLEGEDAAAYDELRRELPQRQSARDRPAKGCPWRSTAAGRARGQGRRI